MEELIVDQESSLASDEMGIWLQRRGIKRRLVPKESHLGLIERHGEILINAMRILDLAAEQEGMQLDVKDLLWECISAKNGTH